MQFSPALSNGRAYFLHEPIVKSQIMQGMEVGRKDFSGHIEVAEVSARKMPAAIATAGLVHRAMIAREFRAFNIDLALGCE